MTVLASSLKRIWSAKGRVPHLTGRGTRGSSTKTTAFGSAYEGVLSLIELARHSAPSVVVIVLNIFR
jgi:hypothetical protein